MTKKVLKYPNGLYFTEFKTQSPRFLFFVLHFLMLIKNVKHIFVSSLKSNLKLLSSSVYCLSELPSRKFHETAEGMNDETIKYPKCATPESLHCYLFLAT